MKGQIPFSRKKKEKISPICRLLNSPREWIKVKGTGYTWLIFRHFFYKESTSVTSYQNRG